jgi:DHA2 family multidrug resistance protein-like MFS transporter
MISGSRKVFAMFVTFFFLTQYFQIVQGRSALEAGLLLVAPAAGMIVGSGLAGKLIHTAGPRALSVAMVVVVVPLVLLTGITETTNAGLIALVLGFFGLGAGLGMPAMTDTVMAAVPERGPAAWGCASTRRRAPIFKDEASTDV